MNYFSFRCSDAGNYALFTFFPHELSLSGAFWGSQALHNAATLGFVSKFAYLAVAGLLEEAAVQPVAVLHDENDVDQQPRERCYEDDPTGAHSHLSAEHSRVVCH